MTPPPHPLDIAQHFLVIPSSYIHYPIFFSQPQPAFVGNEIDNGEVKVGLVQLAEQCLVLQDHLWDGGAIDTTMMITITIDIDK